MIKHILMIVIDCLRADHVSANGYARHTTPTIDELAASGICWTNAHSVSSWTKPSVTSLLTGYYPREHGATRGVKRGKLRARATSDTLSSQATTLAERLSSSGFRCGAFINNVQLDRHSGVDRGFCDYVANGGRADRLIASVENWIRKDPHAQWFAYMHFLEAHLPYKPRRRHVEMFGGNRDTNPLSALSAREFGQWRKSVHRGEATFTAQNRDDLMVLYDGAVRRLDGKLKAILKLLDRFGLDQETAIVVTSDHGEEFLDHGSFGHGHTLFEELTHVPLVARVPGAGAGVRVADPVSHVDVTPTLLRLAGVDTDSRGRDLIDPHGSRSPVVSELVVGDKTARTIIDGRWKLHRQTTAARMEGDEPDAAGPEGSPEAGPVGLALFDLAEDPKEQVNLIETEAGRIHADRLGRELAAWSEQHHPLGGAPASDIELDDRVVQRLRDLGYVE